ncbi:MAG TPA: FAD-dependent oxidoreductase [Candidatus Saccharimonadia bacterium]
MRPLRLLDNLLNAITMYRLVLYCLGGLAAVALLLAGFGALSQPLLPLAGMLAVLLAVCYVTNRLLAIIFDAATNTESALITALILFFVLLPPSRGLGDYALVAGAGLIAMASKYMVVWRRRHIVNPAALAAFVLSVTGLYSAGWWVATPVLLPATLIVGLLVVRKIRRFQLVAVYTAAAVFTLVLVSLPHGLGLPDIVLSAFTSWPIIFFGTIMLTEPATLPAQRSFQLVYAGFTGVLCSSLLHWGPLATTPQAVLVLANALVFLIAPKFTQRLRLVRQVSLGARVTEFQFAPERPITFAPGQYLEVTLPHAHPDARGNRRTFSIASAPGDAVLRLGVKFYEPSSSFKTALRALQPGGHIFASNLGGSFTLPANPARPLLFVAGGIGITPFRSMAADLVARGEHRDIVLLYLAAPAEQSYGDVFAAAQPLGLRLVAATDPYTPEALTQTVPDLASREVYLSGPQAMVDYYKDLLRGRHVPRRRIHTDYFSGY